MRQNIFRQLAHHRPCTLHQRNPAAELVWLVAFLSAVRLYHNKSTGRGVNEKVKKFFGLVGLESGRPVTSIPR